MAFNHGLSRQSLSRRIVIAFVLMTLLVGGTFSVGIVETVHQVEERLISSELGGDLGRFLQMESLADWRHEPEPGQLFYFSGGLGDFALPADLQELSPGFHEVFREDKSFHGFVQLVDGRRYVLLQDQSEFEDREQLLFAVVLVGFLISLALSGLLGWLLARKVIEPVVRLSRQVRQPDQLLDEAPQLARDYAGDEVGQLAASFDTTLGLLRRALMRERLFTSDVSHELRTPLMIVSTSCELLARGALPDNSQRQVARIAKAGADMQALVETFLQLARVQTTRLAESDGVSLEQIAAEQVAVWQPQIEARGLSFVYRQEATVPGRWHPTLLRVVLGNLLRNALHYTEQGEIRLCLEAGGFRVEDTGPGIAPEELGRIFEPFQRGRHARGEGLGLGLSLVRRVCAQAGWSVTAEALAAGGSCFRVRLRP